MIVLTEEIPEIFDLASELCVIIRTTSIEKVHSAILSVGYEPSVLSEETAHELSRQLGISIKGGPRKTSDKAAQAIIVVRTRMVSDGLVLDFLSYHGARYEDVEIETTYA